MSREELAVWAAVLMLGVVAWFLRRLIVGWDSFKKDVYNMLREHGEELARIDERHRLEDGAGRPVFLHRRSTDG